MFREGLGFKVYRSSLHILKHVGGSWVGGKIRCFLASSGAKCEADTEP